MAFEALGEPTKFYLDQKNCETSILLILSKKYEDLGTRSLPSTRLQ